jgi:hypothetical protein
MEGIADIDAMIARFAGAADVMTANLLDLEANPTNKMLDPATLTGVTRQRVTAARQALAALWEHFTEFKSLVQRARELRGSGARVPPARLQQLDDLLRGPSINLPPLEVALADRGLYTPSQTPVAMTADQLLAGMGAAFEAAKSTILAVDEVWRTLVPRLGQAEQQLEALEGLARPLGEPVGTGERTRVRLQDVSRQLANDPLSVDPGELEQLEATLSTERARLDQLGRDRATLQQDLEAAGAQLTEISQAIAAGAAALTEVQRKCVNPQGLLGALDTAHLTEPQRGLAPWLQRLRHLADGGDWRAACRGLDQWQRVAADTLSAARQVVDANSAPLRVRNELRGRLDALQAKAGRLGLTEDPALSALAEQARTVLYTAPTDLQMAADLVARYGSGLTASSRQP